MKVQTLFLILICSLMVSSCLEKTLKVKLKGSGASCPVGNCPCGYVEVPANPALGVTSNFCVMQFDAKNVGNVATSQALTSPWVNINQTTAKASCESLGTGYDLISNPEWMTIARNAENVASNWSSGIVGTGMIPRGHSDDTPSNALAVTDISDPYNGTGNTSGDGVGTGWEQKRTLTLSNGNVVWDIAGNVWEWVDWTPPTTCTASWTELPSVSCGTDLATTDYMPSHASYDSTKGMGLFYGAAGGAALRGGPWGAGTYAGAFTLRLSYSPSITSPNLGFRCVYRP